MGDFKEAYWQAAPKIINENLLSEAAKIPADNVCVRQYDGDTIQWTSRPADDIASGGYDWRCVKNSVLDCIGHTPLIRLSRFAKYYGIQCDLLAKCEFLNPGGSTKDRIGLRMVELAEEHGQLKSESVLVEATSGNTGTGLAMVAAVKGYPMVVTLPVKMSDEKCHTMQRLGAEIVRTPNVPWNDPESNIAMATRLSKALPNAVNLDQYCHHGNPAAHYSGTGSEIAKQCEYKLDMIIVSTGTGGTMSGVSQIIKKMIPQCTVVGVDPHGSCLAIPPTLNTAHEGEMYTVEGIGYDFIPDVLNRKFVDTWVKSNDEQAYRLARDLIRLEGLLVGGSSGSAMVGVLEAARNLRSDQRCVVVLPDSLRNYMTKFCNDDWMFDNGFIELPPPIDNPIMSSYTATHVCRSAFPMVKNSATMSDLVNAFAAFPHLVALPIFDESETTFEGVVTLESVTSAIISGRKKLTDIIGLLMQSKFKQCNGNLPVYKLVKYLEIHSFVVVTDPAQAGKKKILGIVSQKDILFALLSQMRGGK